jgi:hypothetical protein
MDHMEGLMDLNQIVNVNNSLQLYYSSNLSSVLE